jgi:hypothetical protein
MLSGDAVLQTSVPNSLNGDFTFLVAGSSINNGITRVGRFTVSGANLTKVLADTNTGGTFFPTNNVSATNISLDAANPGRGTLTFTDANFPNRPISFVFYLNSPTQGVIQETTGTNGVAESVSDGTIAAQSGGPFSTTNITGTYALNWSGLSSQQGGQFIDEEDLLAQATVTSLALSGTSDIFQFTAGAPQTGLALGGTIKINGDGSGGDGMRSTLSVIYNKSSGATVNSVIYFANPGLAFFANNTNTGTQRTVAGILKLQQ